ncbi:MAG: preprotein translocase subunit YajC [Planctomycetota bacterium]|nr:preprotein translocase subunit YajC [Planctomycetota bacterium]
MAVTLLEWFIALSRIPDYMPTSILMFVPNQGSEQPTEKVSFNSPRATTEVNAESVVDSSSPQSEQPVPNSGTGFWIMIALLFGFMYLFVIRPEKKRQKERTQFQSDLSKGDSVVTAGGLHGVISALDESTVTLKINDNVRIKFDRIAVSRRASTKAEAEK